MNGVIKLQKFQIHQVTRHFVLQKMEKSRLVLDLIHQCHVCMCKAGHNSFQPQKALIQTAIQSPEVMHKYFYQRVLVCKQSKQQSMKSSETQNGIINGFHFFNLLTLVMIKNNYNALQQKVKVERLKKQDVSVRQEQKHKCCQEIFRNLVTDELIQRMILFFQLFVELQNLTQIQITTDYKLLGKILKKIQNSKKKMIDNQQLFQVIPKHISDWNEEDVLKWFQLNNIQIRDEVKLNGKEFLNLTPTKLYKQLKISHFLTRKIADWIQNQVQDFQDYINQIQKRQSQLSKSSSQEKKTFKQLQKQKCQKIIKNQQQNDSLPKYKSESGIKQNIVEIQQYKSEGNQAFKFLVDEDQSTQFYKPLKYQMPKNWSKKQKNSQNNISQQPKTKQFPKKIHNSELVLKDLMQNGQSNPSQIQTCKHLPEDSEYYNNGQQNISNLLSPLSNVTSNYFQKNVKMISSHLILPNCNNILVAYFDQTIYPVYQNTSIGRSRQNGIVLRTDGVSRNHAQITVQEQEVQLNLRQDDKKMIKRYYLEDIGSKFGTFVNIQPEKPKKVSQNQCYCIGETIIKIIKLKIYKNKQKFDLILNLLLEQEHEKHFTNKSQVTIGNSAKRHSRQREQAQNNSGLYRSPNNPSSAHQITKRYKQPKFKDLELQDDPQIKYNHCRFVFINGDVYFQEVQGVILQKIQPNVKMEFTSHKYQIKFGDGNVTFVFENGNQKVSDLVCQ